MCGCVVVDSSKLWFIRIEEVRVQCALQPYKYVSLNVSQYVCMTQLQREILAIVDALASSSYHEIVLGLVTLESMLHGLVPLVKKFLKSGVHDPRLAAFVSLQDSFQFNLASGLISSYRTFAEIGPVAESTTVVLANRLLQGILLVHPESRNLFGTKGNMQLMLSFLDLEVFAAECVSFVSLFIHILLKNIKNMRVFEACGGCLRIIRHLQLSSLENSNVLQQNLHFKVIEFLIFYLTDEAELQDQSVPVLSVEEKADLFRPDFPAIEELIDNLNDLTSLGT